MSGVGEGREPFGLEGLLGHLGVYEKRYPVAMYDRSLDGLYLDGQDPLWFRLLSDLTWRISNSESFLNTEISCVSSSTLFYFQWGCLLGCSCFDFPSKFLRSDPDKNDLSF